jgi:hypothetical protein
LKKVDGSKCNNDDDDVGCYGAETQMDNRPIRMDTQNEDEIYQAETQLHTNSPSIANPAAITHADGNDNNINLSSQSETPLNEEWNDAMSLGTKNVCYDSPPKDDTEKIEEVEEIINETIQSPAVEADPSQSLVATDTISSKPVETGVVETPSENGDTHLSNLTIPSPMEDKKTTPSDTHEAESPDTSKTVGGVKEHTKETVLGKINATEDDNKDPQLSQKSINSMTNTKSDLTTPNNDRSTRRRSGGSSSEGRKENNDTVKVIFTGLVPTQKHKKMISDIGAQLVESIEDAATATRE